MSITVNFEHPKPTKPQLTSGLGGLGVTICHANHGVSGNFSAVAINHPFDENNILYLKRWKVKLIFLSITTIIVTHFPNSNWRKKQTTIPAPSWLKVVMAWVVNRVWRIDNYCWYLEKSSFTLNQDTRYRVLFYRYYSVFSFTGTPPKFLRDWTCTPQFF